MAYIRFVNINKFYGNNHVLKGINLIFEKGQLVTLLGPSGCGKSTFCAALPAWRKSRLAKFIWMVRTLQMPIQDRAIGMVFQQYSLFPNLAVAIMWLSGLKMKKEPKDDIDRKLKIFSIWSVFLKKSTIIQASFPEASSSVSPWPGLSSPNPRYPCWMSHYPPSMLFSGAICRIEIRRIQRN